MQTQQRLPLSYLLSDRMTSHWSHERAAGTENGAQAPIKDSTGVEAGSVRGNMHVKYERSVGVCRVEYLRQSNIDLVVRQFSRSVPRGWCGVSESRDL